jgi:hypothetical protein
LPKPILSKYPKIQIIQIIPRIYASKNPPKRPPHPSDHPLDHPSAANDSAPSHRFGLFKSSPEYTHPRIPQNGLPIRRTIRRTIRPPILHRRNPQHNGLHVTTRLNKIESIKVRPRKWGRRTLKK